MAATTTPPLPVDILLQIAERCLGTFSRQEQWFKLSRVSRLFRRVVEDAVLRETRRHQSFNADSVAQIGAEAMLTVDCRNEISSPERHFSRWAFSHIDERDPTRAVFVPTSPQELATGGPLADTLAKFQHQIDNAGERPKFRFTSIAWKLWNRSTGSAISGQVDIGSPVLAEMATAPGGSDDDEVIHIAFEWRKIWTIKCAYRREVEERQAELRELERQGIKPKPTPRGRHLSVRERKRRMGICYSDDDGGQDEREEENKGEAEGEEQQ